MFVPHAKTIHDARNAGSYEFRHSKGFTLVELLILVAILAIFAIFAIPSINNALDESDSVNCESRVEMLRRAKSMYVIDHLGVNDEGELPFDRYVFGDRMTLDERGRGVLRAYLPDRFDWKCPRDTTEATISYSEPYNLYHRSQCNYCQENPRQD
jgi:prepilin-type N-terminal cleavage/methylation domain-containing protein